MHNISDRGRITPPASVALTRVPCRGIATERAMRVAVSFGAGGDVRTHVRWRPEPGSLRAPGYDGKLPDDLTKGTLIDLTG